MSLEAGLLLINKVVQLEQRAIQLYEDVAATATNPKIKAWAQKKVEDEKVDLEEALRIQEILVRVKVEHPSPGETRIRLRGLQE